MDSRLPDGYTPGMDFSFDWRLIATAAGLAFVFEGLPYFLLAERMPKVLLTLAAQGPRALRLLGLVAALAGIGLIAVARSF